MKKLLLDFSLPELGALLGERGLPAYRVRQIFKWLHSGKDFDMMTDLPMQLRADLAAEFLAAVPKVEAEFRSKDGVTVKYLYRMPDDEFIEGVLMSYKHGNTLCVSTQIGCRMGCAFCASGIGGLVRNLSAGEILGQVLTVNALLGGTLSDRRITNLVLMGSGEPLDNYDNVAKFLTLVSNADGINISRRNISLSTCGLADKIRRLADDGFGVTLTISLHSPTDEGRMRLIPAAKKFSIADIMNAARYYFNKTGRRVIFEYALVQGENDSRADALRLIELTRNLSCHVNLIMLNEVKEKQLIAASRRSAEAFLKVLTDNNCSATIRRSLGTDIQGACGQLCNQYVGQKDPVSSAKKP